MFCELRVRDRLDLAWADWFGEFTLSYPAPGETLLCGCVADQADLLGVLNRVHLLNLHLLALSCQDCPQGTCNTGLG